MPIPARRFLEERLIQIKGDPHILLRDPEGLFDGEAILPSLLYLVYTFLDGTLELEELQKALTARTGGILIPADVLRHMVDELDKHHLLENERTAAKRKEVVDAFTGSKVRAPRFVAGTPEEVGGILDSAYKLKEGAGAPTPGKYDGQVRAIVAPHIDFARGGFCYTHAYRTIAESEGAGTYLILGVAHRSPPTPYVLSTKGYGTALGTAEVDREFVDALTKRAGRKALDHEIVHLTEHSAEFQAVFLKHALKGREPFRIVPILCSAFESTEQAEVTDFVDALAETIKENGRSVCIVAGVDFSHVGPHFGDEEPLDDAKIEWMRKGDATSLASVSEGDAEGFWESVMEDGNRRRVCGLTATWTALKLLGRRRGEILRYGYAPDPGGGVVSFASAVFR